MVALVLGTRPEIIKLASVIRALEQAQVPYSLVHTGQHYSENMNDVFFESLQLKPPTHHLKVGSASHALQTAKMMTELERVFSEDRPEWVIVQGDTNSTLAAALVAAKMPGIRIGHVEAGLRSFDRAMPEEVNRILVDHLADHLYCPTDGSRDLLLKEGISSDKIFVTGNTVVDSLLQNLEIAERSSSVLANLEIDKGQFALVTLHRQENVDDDRKLQTHIENLNRYVRDFAVKAVFPIHPRARKRLDQLSLKLESNILPIEPVGFFDFLVLQKNARLILTDSGGVQEEACVLKTPCLTLRENTERPETVEVGANLLVGSSYKKLSEGAQSFSKSKRNWQNPFGDGKASERIVDFLRG